MITCDERRNGEWVALTFAHPKGNILTEEMVAQWRQVLATLSTPERARHIKLLTIEGQGADFSFGASIVEHAPDRISGALPDMNALILDLLRLPMPTAALVHGRCLGGGLEVALTCDFVLADSTAQCGLPEIAIGAFAPIASVLLPHRVGLARATSALLTGRVTDAEAWRDMGLIEHVWPQATFAQHLDDWFDQSFGRWSAEALRHAVRAARRELLAAAERGLPEMQRLYLDSLAHTHDASEGVAAFLQKRRPTWTNS